MPRSRPAWSARRTGVISMAAAGVIALTMSGCTGAPEPPPTPSATTDAAEPIFASDEEALAAAEDSYARYLEVVDKLTQDGGSDPDRVKEVATAAYAVELLASLQRLRESGNHTVGETRYEDMRLIERGESEGSAKVSVYLCLDVSDVRVVDTTGADVTQPDRAARSPIQAHFESLASNPAELLPSGSESWPGDDFC